MSDLQDAKDLVEDCEAREGDNRREAAVDIKFRAGEQWDETWMRGEERRRMKQAAITVNQLPQYLHQVVNDIRHPPITLRQLILM